MRALVLGLIMAVLSAAPLAVADELPLDKQVEQFFTPHADLLHIKLAVDKILGDNSNPEDTRKAFEALAAALASSTGPSATVRQKYLALKQVIYEASPWNNNAPFSYDLSDPKGRKPENRLLSHYLSARKGNCITMPFLAMTLGRRIGLKMTLALAPYHEFVKITDETGREMNLEATSGLGPSRDQHYRDELPMADSAIAQGTYLKALSDEEVIAVIASEIVFRAIADKRYGDALAVSDVLLKHAPNNVVLLVSRGSTFGHMLEDQFLNVYGHNIPPELRPVAHEIFLSQERDFAKAEALGWRENEGQKGVPVQ